MYNVHIGLVVFPRAITGSCNKIPLVFTNYGLYILIVYTVLIGKNSNDELKDFELQKIQCKIFIIIFKMEKKNPLLSEEKTHYFNP